ncbi:EpsG family protein [Janibacter sp. FSL W8-0316]|uniref:EpsG family protein n=1 Tax=Janibacter sp. FSL W8-0316 TaxID=2975325 RepID=UPI0030FD08E0
MGFALICAAMFGGLILSLAGPIRELGNRWNSIIIAVILGATFVTACAVSDYEVDDKYVYSAAFQSIARVGDVRDIPLDANWAFSSTLWLFAKVVNTSDAALYGSVALAIFTAFTYCSFRYVADWGVPGALVTALSTGILYSYSVVAIRQGLSMALLLIAIATMSRESGDRTSRVTYVVLGLAASMHWSAALPAAILAFHAFRPLSVRTALALWVVMGGLYLADIQELLLNPILQSSGVATDLISTSAYSHYGASGNRLDFFLVSLAVGLLGLLAHRRHPNDPKLRMLLVCYLLLNSMFLTFGFIAYADRVASYSWILAPLIAWRLLGWLQKSALPAAFYIASVLVGVFVTQGIGMFANFY